MRETDKPSATICVLNTGKRLFLPLSFFYIKKSIKKQSVINMHIIILELI